MRMFALEYMHIHYSFKGSAGRVTGTVCQEHPPDARSSLKSGFLFESAEVDARSAVLIRHFQY